MYISDCCNILQYQLNHIYDIYDMHILLESFEQRFWGFQFWGFLLSYSRYVLQLNFHPQVLSKVTACVYIHVLAYGCEYVCVCLHVYICICMHVCWGGCGVQHSCLHVGWCYNASKIKFLLCICNCTYICIMYTTCYTINKSVENTIPIHPLVAGITL